MSALLPSTAVRVAAELAGAAAAAVRPDQLADRTPCRDWDVRGVLDHLAWAAVLAQRSATRLPLEHDWTSGRPAPFVDGVPVAQWGPLIAEELDVAADAWADVAAWQGETLMGTAPMPAEVVGPMMLADIALHGWDVARAVGAPYPVAAELGEAVLAAVVPIAPMGRDGGWYAAEVPVPADAPAFDRALGLTGRDPGWTR
ncbi:TIGR03086 family metal-binding protein [Modestobacter sp. NPDC049651]|uniref:TIGR03086 family metal-binding protein n=1 Tax=unclassified Modestobacter TaxID=2643866 RepID=UPI0033D346A0